GRRDRAVRARLGRAARPPFHLSRTPLPGQGSATAAAPESCHARACTAAGFGGRIVVLRRADAAELGVVNWTPAARPRRDAPTLHEPPGALPVRLHADAQGVRSR